MSNQSTAAPAAASPLYTEPERITVQGLELAYRRKGGGEPLLYLHGAGMTRRWLPLYEELARHCDLIVPEHPGFGDTPLPSWLEGFDDVVLFYADVANALGLDTFHLAGHSLGGWIAAEIAVFYPERLRSLSLLAPVGVRVRGEPRADTFKLDGPAKGALLFNGRADAFTDYLLDGDEQETFFRAYAESTAQALLAWNPRYDRKLDHRLARVDCPAQVIAPQEDRIVPRSHFEKFAQLIPGADLVTVEGREAPTSHGFVAEEPERIAAQVARLVG